MTALLEVRNLQIGFPRNGGHVYPVDGIDLTIERGETVALVGESGSGKTLTSLALLRLVPEPGRITSGSAIRWNGEDILDLKDEALRQLRGGKIGMIFQDPSSSLNPVLTVGSQVVEAITAHQRLPAAEARRRAVTLLNEVGIPDPDARFSAYPHQLSGGLKQRVMIAIALATGPELLIADEPTTALDVTVQAQILELLDRLKTQRSMAVLLITHDLGIVAGRANRVAVMYAGEMVEQAPTDVLFRTPAHPYTRALLRAMPRLTGPLERLEPIPGTVPLPGAWPTGCRFHPRCTEQLHRCATEPPGWSDTGAGRARCWRLTEPKP